MRKHPLCFVSKAQYKAWQEKALKSEDAPSGYCTDCTPEYQTQMIVAGKCEYPGTVFDTDEDGFVEGTRPGVKKRHNHSKIRKPVKRFRTFMNDLPFVRRAAA